jgi:hypothetical protein
MPGILLRKAHAYSLAVSPDGPPDEAEYLRCCHCQHFWRVMPGSGNQRGWCNLCAAPHCGSASCWDCRPFMKRIEEQERRQRQYEQIVYGRAQT